MSNSALAAQWDVGTTTNNSLAIVRGLVISATSDNIGILALVACERFGSTISISATCLRKIELLMVPREPTPIAFLKSVVGFQSQDSAVRLGESTAGIRFLALAAALIPTLGHYEGATALDIMLRESASDLTLVPPLHSLRDLLSKLEPRAQGCGFFESVALWQTLVQKEIMPKLFHASLLYGLNRNESDNLRSLLLNGVPPAETVASLVAIFRKIGRLGSETVVGVTIRAGTAVPWILAFAQWCLDTPPSLVLGKVKILDPPGSRVSIRIPNKAKQLPLSIKAIIHHHMDTLSNLIAPRMPDLVKMQSSINRVFNGMVPVTSYGEWLLRELGLVNAASMALHEALEYAIPLIVSYANQSASMLRQKNLPNTTFKFVQQHQLRPFPRFEIIANTASMLLGLDAPLPLNKLANKERIMDLPQVALYLKQVLNCCRCSKCYSRGNRGKKSNAGLDMTVCNEDSFFRSLTRVVIDILALSTFHDPPSVLLKMTMDRYDARHMRDNVENGLRKRSIQSIEPNSFTDWARSMLGYEESWDIQEPRQVVVSHKGQVVYNALYETFHFERFGYLQLICLPGVLIYENSIYKSAEADFQDDVRDFPASSGNTPFQPEHLTKTPSFRNLRVVWDISVIDEERLRVSLTMFSKSERVQVTLDPSYLFEKVMYTLILESCPHSRDTAVDSFDRFVFRAMPWNPMAYRGGTERSSHVSIVVTDGVKANECFAIASTYITNILLRRDACISCCLDACRQTNTHLLII